MILKYRVSLPGLKGFARVYEVKASSSLYSFHKQMRADMDFPQDQVVLFKAFDKDGGVAARYSVFTDFGFGTIDSVTAEQCHKRGEDKFIYFYDTTNVKSVIITFEGEAEERRGVLFLSNPRARILLNSKTAMWHLKIFLMTRRRIRMMMTSRMISKVMKRMQQMTRQKKSTVKTRKISWRVNS